MSLGSSFHQVASPPAAPGRRTKKRREPPFSLRLTPDERARLAREAAGAPLGSYIKTKLLGGAAPRVRVRRSGLPVEDRQALSQALALLGASRMAANLNQLAHAANCGALTMKPQAKERLHAALADIWTIRRLLVEALGLREGER